MADGLISYWLPEGFYQLYGDYRERRHLPHFPKYGDRPGSGVGRGQWLTAGTVCRNTGR